MNNTNSKHKEKDGASNTQVVDKVSLNEKQARVSYHQADLLLSAFGTPKPLTRSLSLHNSIQQAPGPAPPPSSSAPLGDPVKWIKYVSNFVPKTTTLRKYVENAIKNNKTFQIPFGTFSNLRRVLHERGWVEVPLRIISHAPLKRTTSETLKFFDGATTLSSVLRIYKGMIDKELAPPVSDEDWLRFIFKDVKPTFIWHYGSTIVWSSFSPNQFVNRQPKPPFSFTTKVGIATCLSEIHWYSEPGVSSTFFPRCYRLFVEEEKAAFIGDFCLTACIGLIQWIIRSYETDGASGLTPESKEELSVLVPPSCINFALAALKNYSLIRSCKDLDSTGSSISPFETLTKEWELFLSHCQRLVYGKEKFDLRSSKSPKSFATSLYKRSKSALERIAPYWPQLTIDGPYNVWICKPGARSCGIGITVQNQLQNILALAPSAAETIKAAEGGTQPSPSVVGSTAFNMAGDNNSWVVQKYIERPLLIYNTKFDIRQWFVVEDWNPLTVWFYRESYLRFCKIPFNMEEFHESVHLCNFSIQKNYEISESRDSSLPDENVWDNYTFQAYLQSLGKSTAWDEVIYPGMKQAILGVLLASQDSLFSVPKNAFELYGADFMLSDELVPWLIEINNRPLMSSETEVYRRMCSQVVEDCVKVIIDLKENPEADTGMFELIYKQNPLKPLPSPTPNNIILKGRILDFNTEEGLSISSESLKNKTSIPNTATPPPPPLKTREASLLSLSNNSLYFTDLIQRIPLRDPKKRDTISMDVISSEGTQQQQQQDLLFVDRSRPESSLVNNSNSFLSSTTKGNEKETKTITKAGTSVGASNNEHKQRRDNNMGKQQEEGRLESSGKIFPTSGNVKDPQVKDDEGGEGE